MNIDNIRIKVSLDNINDSIQQVVCGSNVKDISVEYDNNVLIKGKYKFRLDIPFSIIISKIITNEDSIVIHIKEITFLIRIPGILKDTFIKEFIKQYKDSLLYKDDTLILNRNIFQRFLPFDDFKINSLNMSCEGIEIEFSQVKLIGDLVSEAINDIEVDDVKIEDFTVEKALDYYEKLRNKIKKYVTCKIPVKYHYLIPYLLLLPDMLILLIRLFKDKRVNAQDKIIIIAGITYIISPFDIIPDFILPFGIMDDLGITFFVLDKLLLSVPEQVLCDNFSGDTSIINIIRDNYLNIKNMIPAVKMDKVLNVFSGILKKVNYKQEQ